LAADDEEDEEDEGEDEEEDYDWLDNKSNPDLNSNSVLPNFDKKKKKTEQVSLSKNKLERWSVESLFLLHLVWLRDKQSSLFW
jgi:hypothetical protein